MVGEMTLYAAHDETPQEALICSALDVFRNSFGTLEAATNDIVRLEFMETADLDCDQVYDDAAAKDNTGHGETVNSPGAATTRNVDPNRGNGHDDATTMWIIVVVVIAGAMLLAVALLLKRKRVLKRSLCLDGAHKDRLDDDNDVHVRMVQKLEDGTSDKNNDKCDYSVDTKTTTAMSESSPMGRGVIGGDGAPVQFEPSLSASTRAESQTWSLMDQDYLVDTTMNKDTAQDDSPPLSPSHGLAGTLPNMTNTVVLSSLSQLFRKKQDSTGTTTKEVNLLPRTEQAGNNSNSSSSSSDNDGQDEGTNESGSGPSLATSETDSVTSISRTNSNSTNTSSEGDPASPTAGHDFKYGDTELILSSPSTEAKQSFVESSSPWWKPFSLRRKSVQAKLFVNDDDDDDDDGYGSDDSNDPQTALVCGESNPALGPASTEKDESNSKTRKSRKKTAGTTVVTMKPAKSIKWHSKNPKSAQTMAYQRSSPIATKKRTSKNKAARKAQTFTEATEQGRSSNHKTESFLPSNVYVDERSPLGHTLLPADSLSPDSSPTRPTSLSSSPTSLCPRDCACENCIQRRQLRAQRRQQMKKRKTRPMMLMDAIPESTEVLSASFQVESSSSGSSVGTRSESPSGHNLVEL